MTAELTTRPGAFVLPALDRIVYGRAAAEVVPEEAKRLGAPRVFLMVSGTMHRTTDEVSKLAAALGDRHAGTFDAMHDECLNVNPRKIGRIEQVLEILEAAA